MNKILAAAPCRNPQIPEADFKKIVVTVLLMIAAYIIGSEIPNHLMVAMTNSVGHRLFFYERDQKKVKIEKDAYVVFDLYTDLRENCNPCKVVKKAACVAGETLITDTNGYVYCEGQYLGVTKKRASNGKELTPFIFNGVVPQGKFFAYGGNVNSYDSRYYGFVDEGIVEGLASPIF